MNADNQYTALGQQILDSGVWVKNPRTGVRCLTGKTAVFEYGEQYPIITTRKAPWRMAVAELLGYWQGLTDAQAFADLGAPTWFANANNNADWLKNPARKGINDMGKVYGAIGRDFGGIDQLRSIYNDLLQGIDSRGEILTYWKPDEFRFGCLRPCLHSYQFNLLGDTLHLTAVQRSADVPLGLVANMQQVWLTLALMARITGHKAGIATHVINNPHIYENQLEAFEMQMMRKPIECSRSLWIDLSVRTLDDVLALTGTSKFDLTEYYSYPPIKYEFTA